MTIPSLGKRWHFDTLNTFMKSLNSDSVMSWKLQFYPWVHSWTLQRRKSHFVTIKDISKYTNLLMTIPSPVERRHFDALNAIKKVKIPISWSFGNFNFTHGSIVEHFKQERVTLLQSKISRNILIWLWRFQVYVKDDILIH